MRGWVVDFGVVGGVGMAGVDRGGGSGVRVRLVPWEGVLDVVFRCCFWHTVGDVGGHWWVEGLASEEGMSGVLCRFLGDWWEMRVGEDVWSFKVRRWGCVGSARWGGGCVGEGEGGIGGVGVVVVEGLGGGLGWGGGRGCGGWVVDCSLRMAVLPVWLNMKSFYCRVLGVFEVWLIAGYWGPIPWVAWACSWSWSRVMEKGVRVYGLVVRPGLFCFDSILVLGGCFNETAEGWGGGKCLQSWGSNGDGGLDLLGWVMVMMWGGGGGGLVGSRRAGWCSAVAEAGGEGDSGGGWGGFTLRGEVSIHDLVSFGKMVVELLAVYDGMVGGRLYECGDHIVELDIVDTVVFQLGELEVVDTMQRKKSLLRICSFFTAWMEGILSMFPGMSYGLMTSAYFKNVTIGQDTTLLSIVKLVELGICRFNGLGQGELVGDKLNDSGDEAAANEARRAQNEEGGVRHNPDMSFTNRLKAMDDRSGDIDSNIYTLSNKVENLTDVVSEMSE
ncbi:hypothetical protein Tco_0299638 [Tanacetum coccineum]